jgi:hypothetical protein
MRRPAADVAIYSPYAGPLYVSGGSSGGAEVQSVQLARALATEGLRVRHIVFADGPVEPSVDGVELVKLDVRYRRGGIPRRRATIAALHGANAAVYVQRSAGFETGLVAGFARLTRRRFVFSSSSVADFSLDPVAVRLAGAGLESRITRAQYRVGLRLAHAVVVQTIDQQDLARRNVNVRADVIRSFGRAAATDASVAREGFLWIGAAAEVKDPLAYLELARAVPEARFAMVAGIREGATALAARVRAEAKSIPNLELVDARGRLELLDDYGRALAVVCTSHFEGFPNTFLEAWARGTPALSLRVDPDGVIERHGLGTMAHGSIERLADAARSMITTPPDRVQEDTLRAYIAEHHDPAIVGPQWADLIRSLLR